MNRENTVRWLTRVTALAVAVWCAWPGREPAWLAGAVPSLSPFNALLAVAAGAGGLFLLGALAVACVCAFRPRFFCRWLCPVGTSLDAAASARKRTERAIRKRCGCADCNRVAGSAVTQVFPRIGAALALFGVGAAAIGYPLFGWLDPLAIFNAAFDAARRQPDGHVWLAVAGLPCLLALAVILPGLWCGRVCPLGALQDLLRLPLQIAGNLRKPANSPTPSAVSRHGRRVFLGLGLGAAYRLAISPARAAAAQQAVRPPAAGDGARFTRLCTRCGACARVCPSGIIRFGGSGSGWAGVLAPEVTFDSGYCSPTCTRCGEVCPSGAIPRFTQKTKHAQPMGAARWLEDHCFLGIGRECSACVGACPYAALDLAWDAKNMTSRVVVDLTRCTGCGCCEYVCPTSPKAIRIHHPNHGSTP